MTTEEFLTGEGIWNYADSVNISRVGLKQMLDKFAEQMPTKEKVIADIPVKILVNRLLIIKEDLNPVPFSDVEAAVIRIDGLIKDINK
jgi:hypothetical protein